MRQAIDYVLADELTHVRFGSEWVREFTQGRPGALRARAGVPPPGRQAVQLRRRALRPRGRGDPDRAARIAREAGFTEDELEELDDSSRARARRARRCARPREILRERHLARSARAASRGRGRERAAPVSGHGQDERTTFAPYSAFDIPADLRELHGRYDVEATARRVRNFRYAEEWMMMIIGGWLATMPEVPVKTGLGKIIWETRAGRRRVRQAAPRAALRAQVVSRSPRPATRASPRSSRRSPRPSGPISRSRSSRASSTC